MIPIVQAPKAMAAVQVQTVTGQQKTGTNFSDYMEGKLAAKSRGKSGLLGVGGESASTRAAGGVAARAETDEPLATTGIAALMAQFVQELKQAAEDKSLGAGTWSFPPPAPELMQQMAQNAGMNESQLAGLFEQVKNQDGRLTLVDLLASFSRHFEALQAEIPVTAPETDLPLLQIILERLGVPVPEVEKMSQAVVRGDNSFDLQKLSEFIQGISGERITDLTPLEAEQLQDILAAAGVSGQLQRALLPERLPVIEGLVKTGPPVTLTMDRLKEMLGQAVREVKANQLQADPIAFLTSLQDVLARSGFESGGPQLSSAVQGAIADIFARLMESVDFSQIMVRQGQSVAAAVQLAKNAAAGAEEGMALPEPARQEIPAPPAMLLSNKDGLAVAPAGDKQAATAGGQGMVSASASAPEKPGIGMALAPASEKQHEAEMVLPQPASEDGARQGDGRDAMADGAAMQEGKASGELFAENNGIFQSGAARAEAGQNSQAATQAARPFVHVSTLPPGLQQQSFAQLSHGVLQGLRNQEHHLVLKLYPKELGEVKVEMMVRDNQVAVSFAMENSRVKEVLESNLDQFKDNMAKQGFTLGDCLVSLNKDNDGNEAWRQFQALNAEKGAGSRKTSLADLPEDVFYHRANPGNIRENGVDLFA